MKPRFLLEPTGPLRLWEMPLPSEEYVIGADVSDGISGGDFSCAQILSVNRFKQVGCWHGLEEPYEFGRTLSMLGAYFNSALIAPEVNASGITTVSYLRTQGYPNIYKMKILDTAFPEETERIGWRTTMHTRRLLIDTLRRVIKENSLLMMDPETLDELKTLVKNIETGKIEAAPGNNDDRTMALGIAVMAALEIRDSRMMGPVGDFSYTDKFRQNDDHSVPLGRGGY